MDVSTTLMEESYSPTYEEDDHDREDGGTAIPGEASESATPAHDAASERSPGRVRSSIALPGEDLEDGEVGAAPEAGPRDPEPRSTRRKRPASEALNGSSGRPAEEARTRQRDRRLFGTLMGTLRQFKESESAAAEIQRQRASVHERVQSRIKAERGREERPDTQGAEASREVPRGGNPGARFELVGGDEQAPQQRSPMFFARMRVRRRMVLAEGQLLTRAEPAVWWKPLRDCAATDRAARAQEEALRVWKDSVFEECARRMEESTETTARLPSIVSAVSIGREERAENAAAEDEATDEKDE
ncbi:hypothetical protein H632_c336p3 [Helicosporidium sp. ATCC 50920]|nr:hypothetical protein H632_c336p3 [Helicosporidium sp. ATCC 50920]|eukprot:KDD76152.1 hypothetical protein H632_c336p3 [Helicosporidium sp. ATCC 50920]